MLDGLRKEDEKTFVPWLWTMGLFAPFKVVAWGFSGIVNDMIFVYNVLMVLAWFGFNIINCFGWTCIYSLYLELRDLSKLQDLAKLKVRMHTEKKRTKIALRPLFTIFPSQLGQKLRPVAGHCG